MYLRYSIDGEKINVIALYFTLELVQRLLVILHTTLLSLHIYYMPHHHYVLGGKFTNTYLTAVGDALRGQDKHPLSTIYSFFFTKHQYSSFVTLSEQELLQTSNTLDLIG